LIARIDDPGDPRLAPYARVGEAAWLRSQGLFVAEGRLVLSRLIEQPRFEIVSILVTPAARQALQAHLDRIGADVLVCDQAIVNEVTGFNFHRGCLALVRRPQPVSADALSAASVLLALEGVGNPDNVGGIFRAAAAFASGGVLIGPGTGDPLYRKSIRTSMGAVLSVPWVIAEPWPETLHALRARGFRIAALTPVADAAPLAELAAKRHSHVVLLVGAEGEGLSADALATADDRIRIPIATQVDSLNAAVAAAIALYALSSDDEGTRGSRAL
jgi:tRNA G18 (ribose-2'-O)-methylase SpoU